MKCPKCGADLELRDHNNWTMAVCPNRDYVRTFRGNIKRYQK